MSNYEPRTAENVLRAELASLDSSIRYQRLRITGARQQIEDATALFEVHKVTRANVLAALRALGIEVASDD